MQSFQKRVKEHTGYWSCERCVQCGVACEHQFRSEKYGREERKHIQFLEVNAPSRTNADFPTSFNSDDCPDEHLNGHHDLSPFLKYNFPMVSGFVVEPMHTFYAGCVVGRLKSIACKANEGRLCASQLGWSWSVIDHDQWSLIIQVDQRKKLIYEKFKPYEYDWHVRSLTKCAKKYKHHEIRDMLMYTSWSQYLVESCRMITHKLFYCFCIPCCWSEVSLPPPKKIYIKKRLKFWNVFWTTEKFGYPIRPTTLLSSHLPEDALNYGCGVESLRGFVF